MFSTDHGPVCGRPGALKLFSGLTAKDALRGFRRWDAAGIVFETKDSAVSSVETRMINSMSSLRPSPGPTSPAKPSRSRRVWDSRAEWGATWAARVAALLGLISLLSAIFPPMHRRLQLVLELLPAFAPQVAAGATAAIGLLMLSLAAGLRRRKRRAWQVAVGASAALAALHLVKGLDFEEAVLAVGALALLLVTRSAFTGVPDPRSSRRVGLVLTASLGLATAAGLGVLLVDPDNVVGSPGPGRLLAQVWLGLVGAPGPLHFASPGAAGRIASTMLLLGVVVIGLTLTAALRSAGGPHPIRSEEAASVRGLLATHGGQDSLGYFALRDDKSVIFSPTGKAAVAYRVISGVSLASGDPLGDNEAWPAAVDAWLAQARTYAWIPAVLGASLSGAQAYCRVGLDALEMGDEAVVDVAGFSLDGRKMRGVRQAVCRLQRKGHTVRVDRIRDLPADDVFALAGLAQHWRDGQVERGFSMALGRFGDPRDPEVIVVRCFDETGAVQGLLSFVPWGDDGLSLDLMRRSPQSPNGVVEFMVTTALAQANRFGVARFSLNFAVFRAVFERGSRLGAGPMLRLWHRTLLLASRYWQIESLYRANAKYHPTWVPRFICFARVRDLPRIGVAALEAEAFVQRPRRPRWLGGRVTPQPVAMYADGSNR
jgi:lysyl-tRNA synthetase class 2